MTDNNKDSRYYDTEFITAEKGFVIHTPEVECLNGTSPRQASAYKNVSKIPFSRSFLITYHGAYPRGKHLKSIPSGNIR